MIIIKIISDPYRRNIEFKILDNETNWCATRQEDSKK